jgi:hypothetical protein
MPPVYVGVKTRQDGPVLHFLKEMPAWVILGLFILIFLMMYRISTDDFIPRIIDGLVGALLTAIVAQRPKPAVPTSNTNVSAETLETKSMDNATVNTENIGIKKE